MISWVKYCKKEYIIKKKRVTMMQKTLKKIGALCALQLMSTMIATSQFRSPNFFDSWYVHYPFDIPSDDTCECNGDWHWNSISGFWAMTADKAFRSCASDDKCPCPSD